MNAIEAAKERVPGRSDRLLALLEQDPTNLMLMVDAADAALAERRPEVAEDLLARHERLRPLEPRGENLAGLAALQLGRHAQAAAAFQRLVDRGPGGPAIRFNLAWARAMLREPEAALAALDEETARALPQAAMLKVQLLHERGELEQAAELAQSSLPIHPDHDGLKAAVSVLAIDLGDLELAARCAAGAGDHPDALTTLGTLALGEDRATEALAMFDAALAQAPAVPRAWIGRGLAKLLSGQSEGAPADLDRGAEMFGDHLGSWIAAGWAYFINHDLAAARARFEKALAIDPNFAESHGALAVLDLLEGRAEEASRKIDVAQRLDRSCYSAALARVLMAASSGDQQAAGRIFDLAINTPVDDSGRTIAQAMARMGLGRG
jgi:tetratricopeptide (TPR) repeat protein